MGKYFARRSRCQISPDQPLISGAWENYGKNADGFRRRRESRGELWARCPIAYRLGGAGKNLKNRSPFQRPAEVRCRNAPASYSECAISFFFPERLGRAWSYFSKSKVVKQGALLSTCPDVDTGPLWLPGCCIYSPLDFYSICIFFFFFFLPQMAFPPSTQRAMRAWSTSWLRCAAVTVAIAITGRQNVRLSRPLLAKPQALLHQSTAEMVQLTENGWCAGSALSSRCHVSIGDSLVRHHYFC